MQDFPQKLIKFLFIFSLAWLVLSLFGIGEKPKTYSDDLVFFAKESYSIGTTIGIEVLNNTEKSMAIANDCTKTPLITKKYLNGAWETISAERKPNRNCANTVEIPAHEKRVFSYGDQSYELFGKAGKYRIEVLNNGKEFYHEFTITEPGFFTNLWNVLVYAPIYNLLFWLLKVLPGHSLGWAIISLTIIVKTALLVPNHKALKSQKALQKIQPELQAVKEKFKGDQAKIAQATMEIWKKHKVNPAGSCLPILLQFPFLIAMFITLKQGLSANHAFFLYDALKGFDHSLVQTQFLGMDLLQFGPWYLAGVVGGLQFFQMKLSFAQAKKPETGSSDMMADQMQMMNKMFQYMMPIMITLFTVTVPAGVGMYWGISTLYAIGQQQAVNKIMNKIV